MGAALLWAERWLAIVCGSALSHSTSLSSRALCPPGNGREKAKERRIHLDTACDCYHDKFAGLMFLVLVLILMPNLIHTCDLIILIVFLDAFVDLHDS